MVILNGGYFGKFAFGNILWCESMAQGKMLMLNENPEFAKIP
jgi:hypothetical protein